MKRFIQACAVEMEDHSQAVIEFYLLMKPDPYRPYGIDSIIRNSCGEAMEESRAENRFATQEEAVKTIQMLSDFSVMPCTLCDVIA